MKKRKNQRLYYSRTPEIAFTASLVPFKTVIVSDFLDKII